MMQATFQLFHQAKVHEWKYNYKFGIDAGGNYTYSGGVYTANSNANSFPGYDITNGQKIVNNTRWL